MAILFSVWLDDDYLTFDIPGPADPLADDPQDEQRATGPVPEMRPLLPWLRRELEVLAEDQWWEVAGAEGTIVAHLCLCGLDEEALVRHLQNRLTEHTMTFIRQLIAVAMRLCGREIRQHLGQWDPHAAGEEEEDDNDDPEPSPSPISSRGDSLSRPEAHQQPCRFRRGGGNRQAGSVKPSFCIPEFEIKNGDNGDQPYFLPGDHRLFCKVHVFRVLKSHLKTIK
ncbi:translation initiation factor IF-2-like [Grus japonensis]|uniref:Translation initiation factor IF-2-like n=1 Tax=Grus japonensis TaxID=30415 RepID=A0ABC9Y7F5_GRUJA